ANLLDAEKFDLSSVHTMIVGGSAAPQFLIEKMEKRHGIRIIHAWGMTEMSPLGTVSRLKKAQRICRRRNNSPYARNRVCLCQASKFARWTRWAKKCLGTAKHSANCKCA